VTLCLWCFQTVRIREIRIRKQILRVLINHISFISYNWSYCLCRALGRQHIISVFFILLCFFSPSDKNGALGSVQVSCNVLLSSSSLLLLLLLSSSLYARKNLIACQQHVFVLLVPNCWLVYNKLLSSYNKIDEANRLATRFTNTCLSDVEILGSGATCKCLCMLK
jgi:hypothetical protein